MRRVLLSGMCASLIGVIWMLAPVAARASTYDCTSSPALEIITAHSHVSLRTACRVAEKLEAWLRKGHKLVRCSRTGASTLLVHRFDGYRLKEGGRLGGGLVM